MKKGVPLISGNRRITARENERLQKIHDAKIRSAKSTFAKAPGRPPKAPTKGCSATPPRTNSGEKRRTRQAARATLESSLRRIDALANKHSLVLELKDLRQQVMGCGEFIVGPDGKIVKAADETNDNLAQSVDILNCLLDEQLAHIGLTLEPEDQDDVCRHEAASEGSGWLNSTNDKFSATHDGKENWMETGTLVPSKIPRRKERKVMFAASVCQEQQPKDNQGTLAEPNSDLACLGALAAFEETSYEVGDETASDGTVIEESLIRALAKLSTLESALDPEQDAVGSTSFDARDSENIFRNEDDYEDDFEDYEGTLGASRLSQISVDTELEATC